MMQIQQMHFKTFFVATKLFQCHQLAEFYNYSLSKHFSSKQTDENILFPHCSQSIIKSKLIAINFLQPRHVP